MTRPTSARKKLLLFPPMQTFPTNIVSVAAGGITSGSFAAGAIDAAAIAANAIGASEFAQGAADKVWSTAARALTDKAGFTLTAGSYSIRASGYQRGTIALGANGSATATITAVTLARAALTMLGQRSNDGVGTNLQWFAILQLTATNTVTATCGAAGAVSVNDVNWQVEEHF